MSTIIHPPESGPSYFERISTSTTLKIFILGALTLLLMVPLGLIGAINTERANLKSHAEYQIAQSWGGRQAISPPFLVVTATIKTVRVVEGLERTFLEKKDYTLLADKAHAEIVLKTDTLAINSIYTVPTYVARTHIAGQFAPDDLLKLANIPGVDMNTARLGFVASDLKGVGEIRTLSLNDRAMRAAPLDRFFGAYSSLGDSLSPTSEPSYAGALIAASVRDNKPIPFVLDADFRGVKQITMLPLARALTQNMRGNWASPGYTDGLSPQERSQNKGEFHARWAVAEFNRDYPQIAERERDAGSLAQSQFSAELFQPGDIYDRSNRAIKYGMLFIAMSIAGFFMIEILLGVRLHPMHYLQIGLALGLFYLLLLAFSEQFGFDLAYAIAASAITATIAGYTTAVLKSTKRGLLAGAVIGVLYAFLYALMREERYSLAMGATGLFVLLSLAMYLTRNINWYGNTPARIS
jgi:inner membrane protein